MATKLLRDKNVGSTVKLKVNGVALDFIIVHQGIPSDLYDSSCDGTWVLMDKIYNEMPWDSGNNTKYKESSTHDFLNNTLLNLIDENIRDHIKNVKIPYLPVSSSSNSVQSGTNGLNTKIFLLSGYEVGLTSSTLPVDGACLSYFSVTSGTDKKRIAYYNSAAASWWLRSPRISDGYVNYITRSGGHESARSNTPYGIRPALVLDSSLLISSDGAITTNTAPEITANKSGDLGTLTDGFDVEYSVNDEDGDSVTVTETLDDKQIRSYAATLNKQETYSLRGNDWILLANGSHTFKISATDGTETVEHTVTFTRNNHAPVITMSRSGNLGTLIDGVDLTYSVTDADNDAVTVTESFDDKQGRQYAAVLGQQEPFSITGNEWLQLTNSSHTFKVSAFDGQQTAENTVTFTRNQTSLSVTLEEPLTADDNISACQLKVDGEIPDDAVCKYEVTNNSLDWEDCTEETKAGRGHIFKSKGSEFNFRVTIKRGASNKGGYITKIWGGFE